jgi:flagellar biosynthesis component FlhA
VIAENLSVKLHNSVFAYRSQMEKKEGESMETGLAILMVLGIFVGIPALVGIAIGGMYLMSNRRIRRAERARALAQAEAIAQEVPKETVKVAQH